MTKTYDPESYRAGLEAAAKVCDGLAVEERKKRLFYRTAQLNCLASSIRALPVPEKQAVSAEDVAETICDYDLSPNFAHLKQKMMPRYREIAAIAMRACGIKVEG